ncbi:cation transporter [Halomonas campisalis]|uniref:Cation transporter n=1 Tax=Billgrantia campisalis TaxID=74661 RepID=A0ABS9P5H4_9GAMM|nr:cation diffusion facilitator family transporter [Halomonas campisalis]MCG6656669.1 cation transporter [Halomonas campisalis]MDR5861857.1 cation diffusion facilitator family transporter [Halomonas campisalis]
MTAQAPTRHHDAGHDRHQQQARDTREAKRATYIAAWLDGVLGFAKVIVGALVGSAALVADGIHSFSDLITDGFVLAATHYGRQGPDHDHHYGHGRIETLATLLLGSVLIFVAGAIAWSSLQRLFAGTHIAAPGIWAMLLALAALLAKEALFHYTMRIAKRVRSKLLEANAWHSRSDVLSTAVVLVALVGAQFGVGWLDAVAAVIVGLLVGKVGWDLLWESARELVDTALPEDAQQQMHEMACSVPGVRGVHDLRTRQSAGHAMVDLHVVVAPRISVSEAHEIGNEVSRRLRRSYPALSDVTFHIDPEDDEGEGDPSRFPGLPLRPEVEQALAARWSSLPCWPQIRDIRLHYLDERISVVVYLDDRAGPPLEADLAERLAEQAGELSWLGDVEVVKLLR